MLIVLLRAILFLICRSPFYLNVTFKRDLVCPQTCIMECLPFGDGPINRKGLTSFGATYMRVVNI
jgi:hypothetical protein